MVKILKTEHSAESQSILWLVSLWGSKNVIVDITISRRSFVFSQSHVEVSTGLSDVGCLALGALDLVNRSLSVVWFAPLSLTLVSKCRNTL